jgi:hypothetical protein
VKTREVGVALVIVFSSIKRVKRVALTSIKVDKSLVDLLLQRFLLAALRTSLACSRQIGSVAFRSELKRQERYGRALYTKILWRGLIPLAVNL